MNKNFCISVDKDGNMPVLTQNPARPCKPYWVQYRDETPVRVRPYPGQDRIWNYKLSRMEALRPGVQCYSGRGELPVAKVSLAEVPRG